MLILIAGITGNIGHHAARHALASGHTVRGLSRTPAKLDNKIFSQLESFVSSTSFYDIPALDKACTGVDAVICAYSGLPTLHLEGQLLLLHAAERAGIKRFLAASHNNDWRKLNLGDVPIYDSARMFHIQAALVSTIKPLHIFSGTFLDVIFGGDGQGEFTPDVGGVWDPAKKEIHIWGNGNEKWYFTTEEDGGRWAVDLVTSPNAERGGFVSLSSMQVSLRELVEVYQKLGRSVRMVERGSAADLQDIVDQKQKGGKPWLDWFRDAFVLNCVRGTWAIEDDLLEGFVPSPPTSLETWLHQHPEV